MTRNPRHIIWAIVLLFGCGLMVLPGTVSSSAKQDKEPEGKIVAKLDFAPKPNGFHFKNYGGPDDPKDDLGPADLIDLFGAQQVCASGSTAEDCQLTEPAQPWLDEKLKSMAGGHCEGRAVTSLRLLEGKQSRGKRGPG